VPIDLVEADDVDAMEARLAALERRSDALAAVVERFVGDTAVDWDESVREDARAALRLPVPAPPGETLVVKAWGCPECGRVEAPQPCLDVCIRRPVAMADVSEYTRAAERVANAEARDEQLTEVVRLIAHVRPRPAEEQATRDFVRARAGSG
jgi:hypothetical protein